MITKKLVQGTPEWHQHRATARNASDASAMMGCSPYKTRAQLLNERATGVTPEIDRATQARFDRGHAIEEAARPIAEGMIGDDLFPVIGTDDNGYLSASFDGLTMDGAVVWECKTFNKSKAEEVAIGDIPTADFWQCIQQLYVSGAERLLYTLSDGTEEGTIHCWLSRDRAADFFDELLAGWKQFDEDLAKYTPEPAVVEAVGKAPETLPALHIEVTGMVTASNLHEFRSTALAVFEGINRDLTTDQHFADAEKTVKWCKDVEDRLAAAKQHALSQTASIDELFRAIDDISATARQTRLELDKLVKARKEAIREEIRSGAVNAFREHIASLEKTFGGRIKMPAVPCDIASAMKGKKTVASLRDAADTMLAAAKIEANQIADRIRLNLETLRSDAKGYESLFADAQQLVEKENEDLKAVIQLRINEHKAAEEKRLEAERERIRQEEQQKLQQQAEAERRIAEQAAREAAQKAEAPPANDQPAAQPALAKSKAEPEVDLAHLVNADPDFIDALKRYLRGESSSLDVAGAAVEAVRRIDKGRQKAA